MGTVFLLVGLLIIVFCVAYWQWPTIQRMLFQHKVDAGFVTSTSPTYQQVTTPHTQTIEEKLNTVQPGQFIVEMGQNTQVLGLIALDEQMESGGHAGSDWSSTGRKYQVIELSNGTLIAYLPQGDSGDETWFKLERRPGRDLTQFFGGTEDQPGPAMKFADSEMNEDVQFRLVDKTWQIVGIPQYNFEGYGQAFAKGTGTLRCVLAQEMNGLGWLLYIDVFAGSGHDGLYVGQLIEPRVDIDDVL